MTKARDIASAAPAPSTVSATEIGYLDGVTSAIQTQLDAKTATSTLTTTGDIYYASSANTPARLGIGSTGNVLTVSGGIPAWAAPAGGGKVLQVVSATTTTSTTISTGTYTDSGLSATITPSATSSKILVLTSQVVSEYSNNNQVNAAIRLLRGSTSIGPFGDTSGNESFTLVIGAASSVNIKTTYSISYLDSPSTTSATTYKTQGSVPPFGTNGIVFQNASLVGSMILMEIGA